MGGSPVPESTLVRDIMTENVHSLAPDAALLDAVLVMRMSGVRHVPVVEDEALVGVLSDRDVTRAAPSLLEKTTPENYNKLFKKRSSLNFRLSFAQPPN